MSNEIESPPPPAEFVWTSNQTNLCYKSEEHMMQINFLFTLCNNKEKNKDDNIHKSEAHYQIQTTIIIIIIGLDCRVASYLTMYLIVLGYY